MSIQLRAIARPYARALFEIADAQKSVASIRGDLEKLRELIAKSQDFERFLGSPVVSNEEQTAVIQKIAQRLGLSALVTNFMRLLADKHRLIALDTIIDLFEEEADNSEGIWRAEAYAPVKLSGIQLSRLRAALESMTGQKIVVKDYVDESLIGGLLIKVNGQVYDNTIKTQLDALRQQVLRI